MSTGSTTNRSRNRQTRAQSQSEVTENWLPTTSLTAVLDSDGGDQAFRQLLYDLSTVATHLESARAYLALRMDVTSPQYNIIMVVARYGHDAGLSVNGIAERLHVSNTFVTMELKKLERRSLICKTPHPTDARSVLVHLSEQGRALVLSVHEEREFVNNHLFAHISPDDFQALARIVSSLIGDFAHTAALLKVMGQSAPSLTDQQQRERLTMVARRKVPQK